MTPLERLLQEAIPVRPERPDGTHSVWTKQEQDRHWEELADAIGVPVRPRPAHPAPVREDEDSEAAA
jgi:hypothetical protein